ncbi:MAG: ASKHA domain-containing protein [Roseburia sp.]|nr:ASKHA domain-containing protein [Roseburia sp.]
MTDIRIVTGKNIIPQKDTVFELLGYHGEGHSREEMARQYDSLLPKLCVYLKPKAALTVQEAPEELKKLTGWDKVMSVVLTVGKGADTLCKSFFDKGDGFSGLFVSAMADACLFTFEEQVQGYIKRMCKEEGFGICRRLSAPEDLPMEMQKTAFDLVDAKRTLGLSLTSAFMLNPEKSMCYFLAVTEDKDVFQVCHDCRTCTSLDCGLRRREIILTVKSPSEEKKISCKAGERLQDVLLKHGITLQRPCGGMGKCGKCRIKVTVGNLPVTRADENCLTKDELRSGVRLGCQAKVMGDLCISFPQEESEEIQILGNADKETRSHGKAKGGWRDTSYGVAVDIGTTTLAFSLVDLEGKKVIHSHVCMNPQRVYGFDVMSRIQAANQGRGQELRELIQESLLKGIRTLLLSKNVSGDLVKKIIFSGNTTMLHLLRGYSCQGLGAAPFTPVSLERECLSFGEVFGSEELSADIVLPPGASAFIGADIISGLFACGWQERRETALFLDLGTNGEMVLGDGNSFYTASTAAGPAFEGGNITFGTGLIEIVAELLKAGIMDDTGRLGGEYFESGFPVAKGESGEMIRLFQKDIRELQLAKGAVRAGIEVLLKKSGKECKDIHRVYLAGGFGFYLSREKAAAIGLLPRELLEKTAAVGNTSLKGGECYLTREDAGETLDRLSERAREVSLAKEPRFQELYVKYMNFPSEEDR